MGFDWLHRINIDLLIGPREAKGLKHGWGLEGISASIKLNDSGSDFVQKTIVEIFGCEEAVWSIPMFRSLAAYGCLGWIVLD